MAAVAFGRPALGPASAGFALSNMDPEARDARRWRRDGWPVVLAYGVGFFVMLALIGFHPGVATSTT